MNYLINTDFPKVEFFSCDMILFNMLNARMVVLFLNGFINRVLLHSYLIAESDLQQLQFLLQC